MASEILKIKPDEFMAFLALIIVILWINFTSYSMDYVWTIFLLLLLKQKC